MTEKRFEYCIDEVGMYYYICDNTKKGDDRIILELDTKFDAMEVCDWLNKLNDENEELKKLIKELEKQIHLIHMSSMFSTVKSFKGDVSKRYKYSEETDSIYDTANTYGQYNKILDKKEIVMLLNEYETLLGDNVK